MILIGWLIYWARSTQNNSCYYLLVCHLKAVGYRLVTDRQTMNRHNVNCVNALSIEPSCCHAVKSITRPA